MPKVRFEAGPHNEHLTAVTEGAVPARFNKRKVGVVVAWPQAVVSTEPVDSLNDALS